MYDLTGTCKKSHKSSQLNGERSYIKLNVHYLILIYGIGDQLVNVFVQQQCKIHYYTKGFFWTLFCSCPISSWHFSNCQFVILKGNNSISQGLFMSKYNVIWTFYFQDIKMCFFVQRQINTIKNVCFVFLSLAILCHRKHNRNNL